MARRSVKQSKGNNNPIGPRKLPKTFNEVGTSKKVYTSNLKEGLNPNTRKAYFVLNLMGDVIFIPKVFQTLIGAKKFVQSFKAENPGLSKVMIVERGNMIGKFGGWEEKIVEVSREIEKSKRREDKQRKIIMGTEEDVNRLTKLGRNRINELKDSSRFFRLKIRQEVKRIMEWRNANWTKLLDHPLLATPPKKRGRKPKGYVAPIDFQDKLNFLRNKIEIEF